jgi:raffinose/stachyose/melibiose transport system substrate-binding protein
MKIKKVSLVFAMSMSLIVPTSLVATSAQAAPVTLTIESWRADDSVFWKNTLIPMYEKANPGVKIVWAPTPSNE